MKNRIFTVAVFVGIAGLMLMTHSPMADAAEIKTVRFWSDQNEPWQQQVMKEMIGAFEAKFPDVKMEVEYIAFKDRNDKLAVAVAGGTLPEAALLSSQFALSLPAQGLLANLDDVMASLGGPDRFYKAALSLATHDGHFYSLPYSTVPVVMWYRKDLLKKAGLKPPDTWEELYKAAKTLNEQGSGKYFGIGLPYGRNEWTDNAFRIIALWAIGARVLDEKDNVVYNCPETMKALNYYKSLYAFAPKGSEIWGYNETMNSFVTGTTAMALYFGRTLKNLDQYAPDLLPNTGAVLPPRHLFRKTMASPQSIAVYKDSRNPQIGKEFVKFFLTSEYYVKLLWSTPGHNVPVLKDKVTPWQQHPLLQKYPEIISVLLKANEEGMGFPAVKEPGIQKGSKYWEAIQGSNVLPDVIQRVCLKNEDPKKAVEWGEKELKRIISDYR